MCVKELGGSWERARKPTAIKCQEGMGRPSLLKEKESLQSQFCVSLCDLHSLVIHKAQILALSQECCFPMPCTWQLVADSNMLSVGIQREKTGALLTSNGG